MKRALFIAYLFPPQGGSGVQRTVKFLKYLPEFDWQSIVLTGPRPRHATDESLARDVPAETPVVRVRGAALPGHWPWRVRRWITSWLLTVDAQVGWWPFAVRRGLAIARTHELAALYSTSAPYTDHLVAWQIKKKVGVPWVADFRDPWLENFAPRFATRWHRYVCACLEAEIVHTADRVLVVSEPMRKQFLRRYPYVQPDHFVTLTNGYDQADYADVAPVAQDGRRFTLVYTGSLYGKQSGRPLLAAIKRVLQDGAISRHWFRVLFVGAAGKETARLVQSWKLDDVVEIRGYVPHAQMIGHQLGADVLLLIIGSGPHSEVVLTSKIFEYLATGKPILALVPPGAAADLLREARVGHFASPDDPEAISAILVRLSAQWRQGKLVAEPDPKVVTRYDRRELTKKLVGILHEVCK